MDSYVFYMFDYILFALASLLSASCVRSLVVLTVARFVVPCRQFWRLCSIDRLLSAQSLLLTLVIARTECELRGSVAFRIFV